MNLLIIGNLGYVGPELIKYLRKNFPSYNLIGYDIGYFQMQYTTPFIAPELLLQKQLYGDIRNFNYDILNNVDAVIQLAAISNDPIGNKFEAPTMDINCHYAVKIAAEAKKRGVKSFVYASSCSVYGINEGVAKTEQSEVNPLTAYAKSKIETEKELVQFADDHFHITCLRFATACGMSDRLRLDLVLNDFVANAIVTKKIEILSDGSPWRPLINVKDMARAIDWAIHRKNEGGNMLVVNTGSDEWNYQIKDLAYAVQKIIKGVDVEINANAQPDKRSYKVDFSLFKSLAPNHQPEYNLEKTIQGLVDGLHAIHFNDSQFRNSNLIRLNVINTLLNSNVIDNNLQFI